MLGSFTRWVNEKLREGETGAVVKDLVCPQFNLKTRQFQEIRLLRWTGADQTVRGALRPGLRHQIQPCAKAPLTAAGERLPGAALPPGEGGDQVDQHWSDFFIFASLD